jgi:hypothetical protein
MKNELWRGQVVLLAMFTLESSDATSTNIRQLIREKIQDKLQGCKNFEIFCNFLTWKIVTCIQFAFFYNMTPSEIKRNFSEEYT